MLTADTDLWGDPVWLVDSPPVECARSRPTAQRSNLAGFAGYGYCASHSRYFWGLRLHLVCTPAGLPITWALAHPKLDERRRLMTVLDHDQHLLATRPGLLLIADKGYTSAELDNYLHTRGVDLLRPSYRNRHPGPARPCSRRSVSSSSRSTTPSRANSTWNCTAGAPSAESPPASPNGCWLSPPRSGTTARPASPSQDL